MTFGLHKRRDFKDDLFNFLFRDPVFSPNVSRPEVRVIALPYDSDSRRLWVRIGRWLKILIKVPEKHLVVQRIYAYILQISIERSDNGVKSTILPMSL